MTPNPIELISYALQYAQENAPEVLKGQNLTAIAHDIYKSLQEKNMTDIGYKMYDAVQNVNATAWLETGKQWVDNGKELLENGQSAVATAQDFINQQLQDENSYAKPLLFAAAAVTGVALTGLAMYSCMRRRNADLVVATTTNANQATVATHTIKISSELLYAAFVAANPLLNIDWLSGKKDAVKNTIRKMNPWFDDKGNIQLVEKDGETHVVNLVVSKDEPVYTIPVKDIVKMAAIAENQALKDIFEGLFDLSKSNGVKKR